LKSFKLMKKILVIHTNYKEKGGEDISVNNEINLLKTKFDVRELYFNNKNVNMLNFFNLLLFNRNFTSVKKLKSILNNFHPDLVYVHNTWFDASLAIFKVLKKNKIPTAIKLHNYRYFCTRSIFPNKHFKDKYCNACGLEKGKYRILNYYYENSLLKNLLVFRYGVKYFKILLQSNFKLVVLNKFQQQYLANLGIEKKRIRIIHNYIPEINLNNKEHHDEKFIIYAGRISREKGVEELINSFFNSNLPSQNIKLKMIGYGPEQKKLKSKYHNNESIEFINYLKNKNLYEMINKSLGVVSGTKLYEGQPTLFCEASKLKTISVFPSNSGIKEFFSDENIFGYKQEDYANLTEKLNLILDYSLVEKYEKINFEYTNNQLSKDKLIFQYEKLIDDFKI